MPNSSPDAPNYHCIALDEEKRHFVFGDIHGRYASFQNLLKMISYNPATDVIYSVGDLIDRGPQSAKVVEFFQQSSCHAVLGNHEQMVLNPRKWEAVWIDSWSGGRATLGSLDSEGYDMNWLIGFCAALPVCLDVGDDTQEAAFRIVHAECPLEWEESRFISYLSSFSKSEVAEGRLLWGRKDIIKVRRSLAKTGTADNVKVSRNRSARTVVCGHTPVSDIVNAHNVYWIDTFKGGRLTCMDPVNRRFFQAPLADGDAQWQ